jgi:hypothetical protein
MFPFRLAGLVPAIHVVRLPANPGPLTPEMTHLDWAPISILHRAKSKLWAPFSATARACHSRGPSDGVACGQLRARVPHLVGSRLPSPYHFPDSIFSSFCGAMSRRLRFAVSHSRDPSDRNASVQKVDDRLVGLRRDDGARPKSMWKFQIVFHDTLRSNDNDCLKLLNISEFFKIPQITLFGKTKVHKSGPQALRP